MVAIFPIFSNVSKEARLIKAYTFLQTKYASVKTKKLLLIGIKFGNIAKFIISQTLRKVNIIFSTKFASNYKM